MCLLGTVQPQSPRQHVPSQHSPGCTAAICDVQPACCCIKHQPCCPAGGCCPTSRRSGALFATTGARWSTCCSAYQQSRCCLAPSASSPQATASRCSALMQVGLGATVMGLHLLSSCWNCHWQNTPRSRAGAAAQHLCQPAGLLATVPLGCAASSLLGVLRLTVADCCVMLLLQGLCKPRFLPGWPPTTTTA